MQLKNKQGIKFGLAVFVLVMLSYQVTLAQDKPGDDALGVVLGASVARSAKENISKLPVETYFGDPNFDSVKDQLSALNIKVDPNDEISNFPDSALSIGSIIRVTRSTPVIVKDGNKQNQYHTWVGTASELLDEQKIELGDDDKIDPALTSFLKPDITITITRVEITKLTTKEAVDFKKTSIDDPTLDKGLTKIKQVGKKGERTKIFEVRRENGEEVNRKLLENKISKDPVDEITLKGTKEVITVRCAYNDIVMEAFYKYGAKPNDICSLMMKESNGHKDSVNPTGPYYGLFQYSQGFWDLTSSKSGNGTNIFDPRAQIMTTGWAFTHGYRGRWP